MIYNINNGEIIGTDLDLKMSDFLSELYAVCCIVTISHLSVEEKRQNTSL